MDWDMERGVFGSGKLPKPLSKAHLQGFLHPDWEQEGGIEDISRPENEAGAQFLAECRACGLDSWAGRNSCETPCAVEPKERVYRMV